MGWGFTVAGATDLKSLAARPPGSFLLDRAAQSKHLALAWTKYEPADVARAHQLVSKAVALLKSNPATAVS